MNHVKEKKKNLIPKCDYHKILHVVESSICNFNAKRRLEYFPLEKFFTSIHTSFTSCAERMVKRSLNLEQRDSVAVSDLRVGRERGDSRNILVDIMADETSQTNIEKP